MELQILLLFGSIVTLWILFQNRYWTVFPWFMVTILVFSVQGLINTLLPYTSKLNRYIWTPSEILLLVSIAISLGEALWKNTEHMNRLPRFWSVFGIALFSIGMTGLMMGSGRYSPKLDWYHRFWIHREWIYVMYAQAGFYGFWFSLFTVDRSMVAVKHLAIYAGFLTAIRFIPSPNYYYVSHQILCVAEMVALALWCLNSGRLNSWLKLLSQSDPLISKLRFSFQPGKPAAHAPAD